MTEYPVSDVMAQLFVVPKPPAEPDDLPSMNDPGRILFHFQPIPNDDAEIEIIDYDADRAPFWLNEGGFLDYSVRDMISLELDGFYVMEGVTGYGWKDYFGEYDERWEFTFIRRASEDEIRTQALEDAA